jgi:hypothetical protein
VVPRPARDSGVRASVIANSECVRLSKCGSHRLLIYQHAKRVHRRGGAVVAVLVPAPASAWGTDAHRYIMARAIDLLPPELKPFFEHYRAEIVVRSIDPDTWRSIGWEDDPNHFIDFGMKELGAYPFADLPREYGAALAKFGHATLDRIGRLPWREEEEFGNLGAPSKASRRESPYAPNDVVLFSAVAVPLHAGRQPALSRLGQLRRPAHRQLRHPRALRTRSVRALPVAADGEPRPADADPQHPRRGVRHPPRSYSLVDPILKADSDAIAGKDLYDDAYFEACFVRSARCSNAVSPTPSRDAGMIMGAWQQAGKPVLTLKGARPVQKSGDLRKSEV